MRRLHRLFPYVLGVLALTGCATGPAVPPSAAKSYADTRAFEGLPQGDWPAFAWWKAWGDPQLDALIDEAMAGAPTLVAADARVRKAQSLTGEARAAEQPSLTANASAQALKQSYNVGIPAAFVPKGYNDYGRSQPRLLLGDRPSGARIAPPSRRRRPRLARRAPTPPRPG